MINLYKLMCAVTLSASLYGCATADRNAHYDRGIKKIVETLEERGLKKNASKEESIEEKVNAPVVKGIVKLTPESGYCNPGPGFNMASYYSSKNEHKILSGEIVGKSYRHIDLLFKKNVLPTSFFLLVKTEEGTKTVQLEITDEVDYVPFDATYKVGKMFAFMVQKDRAYEQFHKVQLENIVTIHGGTK